MAEQWQCWQCGHPLVDVILPFSRRQVCEDCNADQHVCRLCLHYDANTSGQCNEDRAEDISNKEHANFCDYFSPDPNAFQGTGGSQQGEAREKLDTLFGGSSSEDQKESNSPQDKNKTAKKALEDLFGTDEIDN